MKIQLILIFILSASFLFSETEEFLENRAKEITDWVNAEFVRPQGKQAMVMEYYITKRKIGLEELANHFGKADYKGVFTKKEKVVAYLLKKHGRNYYYAFFSYQNKQILRFYVFPLKERIEVLAEAAQKKAEG